MQITVATAAAAIKLHVSAPTPAQAAAINSAAVAVAKSAALAGSGLTTTLPGGTAVASEPTVVLTAAQLATELNKFEAALLAIKPVISSADCVAFNNAVAAYSAALQA